MTTNIKATIASVLQDISDWRGESQVNTDAMRIRAISRSEQDFATRRYWKIHLLKNVTIAGTSTTDYEIGSATYPMRFKGLVDVRVGGQTEDCIFDIVDENEYQHVLNSNQSAQVCYEYYDTANDKWMLHLNKSSTDTIYYSYYYQPPTKTLTTEYVYCYDPTVIGKMALADIYSSEEEDERAIPIRQEVEQMIVAMAGAEDSPAINQTYQQKIPSGTKGLGTY